MERGLLTNVDLFRELLKQDLHGIRNVGELTVL